MTATLPEAAQTAEAAPKVDVPKAEKAKTAAKPKATPKAAKDTPAPKAEPTGPTGAQLAAEVEKALKAQLGNKLEKVSKQTYFRLMKDGSPVAYVHTHKRHVRIALGVDISNAEDVAAVAKWVAESVALQAKSDAPKI